MTTLLDGLDVWLTHPITEQLGWVLVHFVWQGALLAGALAGALLVLRAEQARLRYALCLTTLSALALCPVVTWFALPAPGVGQHAAEASWLAVARSADPLVVTTTSSTGSAASWTSIMQSLLAASLPWLVAAWIVGVAVLALRLLGGWVVTLRLRTALSHPIGTSWERRTARLAERLGITWRVRVRRSPHIDVPMVMGWLRPVVLIPAGVLTGLPPKQVEALIAHELSHIRRHDVLVGWGQAVVETLLFYHPAVWWISQQVRVEREHCCDDLAVAVGHDRVTYAQALATLAGRQRTAFAGGMSAADGSLLARIRRLVHASSTDGDRGYRPPLLVVGVLLVAGAFGVAACASQRPAGDAAAATPNEAVVASPAEDAASSDEESARDAVAPARESVEVYVAEAESEGDGRIRQRWVVVDSSGHVTAWSDSGTVAWESALDSLGELRAQAPDMWAGEAHPRLRTWRVFGGDTIPRPPLPEWPRVAPSDSIAFVFPDIEVPDVDLGALRALDSLRVPAPPPVFFMGRDTLDIDALRAQMDSLRVVWPRGLELDSLERVRIDSLRRQVERQMRVHREEMRRFDEEHRERVEHLRRELHEQMSREHPERLREQAEALRRQAERLEEQAQEMERQATPDTTGTSGLRGAPSFDAAPFGMLRAGMQPRPDETPAVWFTEPGPALAVLADRLQERAPSIRAMQRSTVAIHRESNVYDVDVQVLSEGI